MTGGEKLFWLAVAVGIAIALAMIVVGGRRGRVSTQIIDQPLDTDLPPLRLPQQYADPPRPAPTSLQPKLSFDLQIPDDTGGEVATERQIEALRRLGLADVAAALTKTQASLILSARDYADTLIERTPREEQPIARLRLIAWLTETDERRSYVRGWAWRTRDHQVRRVPRDTFRQSAERALREF